MLNFVYPLWFGPYSLGLLFLYETLVVFVEFAILWKVINIRFQSLGERQFIPKPILLLIVLVANIASFFVAIPLPFGIAIELGIIILLFHILDLYPQSGLKGSMGSIILSVIIGNIVTGLLILPLFVLLGQYLMIFFL